MDFNKYYSSITNEELLAILQNKDQYQAAAYKAAEEEFANRQLSDEAINDAKCLLNTQKAEKERKTEKAQQLERTVQSTGEALFDSVSPFQTGIPSAERTIRAIAILLTGYFLIDVLTNYLSIFSWIKDIPGFPAASAAVLLPRVVLLIGILAFWRKTKVGWFIVFIIAVVYMVTCILYLTDVYDIMHGAAANAPFTETLFFAGIIYTITRRNIREVYSITRKSIETLAIVGVMTLIIISFIFF